MRYLSKSEQSEIIKQGWRYEKRGDRPKIRNALLREQHNFCAYTERYVAPIDACDIEHFDDRKKHTEQDDYWNWYAVHHWLNLRKRRIDTFLPILSPYDESLLERVRYESGAFRPINENDTEAINLIDFLGWNNPTIAAYRAKTVERIKEIRALHNDDAAFVEFMIARPEYLSFITVLEVELELKFALVWYMGDGPT